ncbi:hypothetical protein DAI21_17895 [Lelliottia sp. WB101]|uniref:hypothetical protein n=1 Tax=Lelliottia sp. WB101 TaxID=2153385 RepID=UPI000D2015DE|nr:hypothetical protein [Lelliottia sp. WB101]AVY99390.1 hypothetical protein DAI21_17895 [Lelliottia sp. WB101]
MWQSKKLTVTGDAGAIICSVLAISPWTSGAGKKESSGVYLSPENAVAWATKKLVSAPSSLDVTAIMVSAPTLSAFATQLAAFEAAFPLASIAEVKRKAVSALSLVESRMQIPAAAGGLPAAAVLSVATLRKAASASAMGDAAAGAGDDIATALRAFKAKRADMLKQAQEELTTITGGSFAVSAVSSVKNTTGAISEMRKEIPHPDHVFSLCIVFAGEDLVELRGMLKDDQ